MGCRGPESWEYTDSELANLPKDDLIRQYQAIANVIRKHGGPFGLETDRANRVRLDTLTRLVCAEFRAHHPQTDDAKLWWEEHREADRKNQLVESALAKLTDDERTALAERMKTTWSGS